MPGQALQKRFRLERRISSRSAAANVLLWAFAFGGPVAVALVLHARLTSFDPGAGFRRFLVAWSGLAAAAVLGALLALVLRRASDRVLAQRLDRRHEGVGLFSAAVALLRTEAAPSALGPVVIARADELVALLPLMSRIRHKAFKIRRTVLFFVLSLILALIPGGPSGSLAGMGAGPDGPTRPEAGSESRADQSAAPESRENPPTLLHELVSLRLRSDHQIYSLGSEIFLVIEIETKRPIATDVPLEIMLAVTDGLPSPDVGFGPGFRPVPLRLKWSIPKEEGGKLKQIFPMKETLRTLGIYRPGLFTAEAFALPALDGAGVSDGARSNELTFQVTENKEDLQTKAPQAQGQQKQPEKKTPDETKSERGKEGGKKKPELGDPDRLADAQRVASLVQPIINPGPTIDKEVSVFDRETGGPAPPLPVARKAPDESAGRTFLRRPEVPQKAPELSVEERDVLRRYFDAIRGQKKL